MRKAIRTLKTKAVCAAIRTRAILKDEAGERCSGTTRKGIEALALKCRGHTGVEIAARYGVAPNHVAAWISKATKMLREERLTA